MSDKLEMLINFYSQKIFFLRFSIFILNIKKLKDNLKSYFKIRFYVCL